MGACCSICSDSYFVYIVACIPSYYTSWPPHASPSNTASSIHLNHDSQKYQYTPSPHTQYNDTYIHGVQKPSYNTPHAAPHYSIEQQHHSLWCAIAIDKFMKYARDDTETSGTEHFTLKVQFAVCWTGFDWWRILERGREREGESCLYPTSHWWIFFRYSIMTRI